MHNTSMHGDSINTFITKHNCVYVTVLYFIMCIYVMWPEIKLFICIYFYYYLII